MENCFLIDWHIKMTSKINLNCGSGKVGKYVFTVWYNAHNFMESYLGVQT